MIVKMGVLRYDIGKDSTREIQVEFPPEDGYAGLIWKGTARDLRVCLNRDADKKAGHCTLLFEKGKL